MVVVVVIVEDDDDDVVVVIITIMKVKVEITTLAQPTRQITNADLI